MSARATWQLVRWLGPWTSDERAPRSVARETIALAPEERAYLYRPARRATGAYVVAPGLHYLGPDDPRMDRFCRVLASAGLVVLAPHLRDHLALRVSPRAADDLATAFDRAEEIAQREGLGRPAVFSISFGSLPTLALAARASHRDRVGGVVLFGGYADFDAAVRFALTGRAMDGAREVRVPFDPLNTPVVYLALVRHLGFSGDVEPIARAWRAMVERTWGRVELKAPGARDAIAAEIARDLPDDASRTLFLEGCGLHAIDESRIEAALAASRADFAFADPTPHLSGLRAPVAIVHGRDDDVIPYLEADKIRARLPAGHPHRVLLTGMVGHTGALLPGPRELAREIASMVGVVRAMIDAPHGRLAAR